MLHREGEKQAIVGLARSRNGGDIVASPVYPVALN